MPKNLGPNGALATGTAPQFYYDGNGSDWNNKGTVSNVASLTGTLTAGTIPGASFSRAAIVAYVTAVAGRKSANPLKIVGIDALPLGASPSGVDGKGILVTADDVVLEDWSVPFIKSARDRTTIRNCLITDRPPYDAVPAQYPIDADGNDCVIEDNDFVGNGDQFGQSAMIVNNTIGKSGMRVRRNKITLFHADGVKTNNDNVIIEFNLVGPSANLGTSEPYDPLRTYLIGETVMDSLVPGMKQYQKLDGSAAGTPLNNTDAWDLLDPHSDFFSVSGGSGIVRYNVIPDQPLVDGSTQQIRIVRDTGQSTPTSNWEVYGNVFGLWQGVFPLAFGMVRDYSNVTVYDPGETARIGEVVYRSLIRNGKPTTSLPTIFPVTPGTDPAYWTLDRDAGVSGQSLFAHNWITGGATGSFWNTDSSEPVASVGLLDATGSPTIPSVGAIPPVPVPTTLGAGLVYTPPVSYGPAQVYTISGVVANGSIVLNRTGTDPRLDNVCAIRVGLSVVGYIDDVGAWHVERQTGVSIAANGGGSYTLRIYDTAGNPMSGRLSIPAGSATVVAEADAASTGPAWGVAPATEISG
jgi:hypothetical protein